MMDKLSIIIGLLKKAISTIDIKVYTISIIIASFIWFIMTMSDNYTERVEFPVQYSNFPPGLVLVNKPAEEISVDVKSQGFELASVALAKNIYVNIDLNNIEFRKSKYGRYVASIATKSFRYNIVNQLQVDDVGKDFVPDSVYFVFDSLITREVPIRFNSKMSYSDGYINYGEPQITPAYVKASGPSIDIRRLKYVYTSMLEKDNVNGDYSGLVSLKAEKDINYNIKEVNVVQEVAKYSEFTFKRKVKLLTNIPNLRAKLFPQKVDILCSMPLPDYKKLSDTVFILTVRIDSLDVLHKKKLLIDISSIPMNADNIRLSNESVEYIIIDKK